MPVPTFNIVGSSDSREVAEALARLQKELRYLLTKGLDSANVLEVGGWSIGPDQMASRDGDVGMSTADTGGDDIRFWAGDVLGGSPNWYVTKSGFMYANNVDIEGKVTARSGLIGGWTIGPDRLSGAGIIEGGKIIGSIITGGIIQTDVQGERIVMSSGRINVYDDSEIRRIEIDSNALPPRINFYDTTKVVGSIYPLPDELLIGGTGTVYIFSDSQMILDTDTTFIYGFLRINGGTPIGSVSQSNSTATTVDEIVDDFNDLLAKLRSMNILD